MGRDTERLPKRAGCLSVSTLSRLRGVAAGPLMQFSPFPRHSIIYIFDPDLLRN